MIAISSTDKKGVDILATQQALNVYQAGLLSGELQQFNRIAGGSIAQYSSAITTTAANAICASPCIFYGLAIMATGTGAGVNVSVWDGTTATGTTWLSSAALTAVGTYIPASGAQATGVLFNNGLTVIPSSNGAVLYALFAAST